VDDVTHRWALEPAPRSNIPLRELGFGDFDGDGLTDVVAVYEGVWSVWSPANQIGFKPLNPRLSDSLASVLITDLDSNGVDDIVRFVPPVVPGAFGHWQVSWDGRGGWEALTQGPGLSFGDTVHCVCWAL
jgi:hypothetical protein